jgi:dTDP-4-amino-4,6-dideoxygalactose transaminase
MRKSARLSAAAVEVSLRLREMTGRKRAVLTGRGAAGIWASLKAMGFADRWVLIPANTCYIVLWAVLRSGNKPFLIDPDWQTGNLTVESLAAFPHGKPAAVIPTHMYGLAAPMADWSQWAQSNGAFLIEDAAQALGGVADGRPAGGWGDAAILSLGPGKLISHEAGGAFLSDDTQLAEEVSRILSETPLWDNRLIDLTNQWNEIYWALHQFETHNPRLPSLYLSLFDWYGDLVAYRLRDWDGVGDMLNALSDELRDRHTIATFYDAVFAGLPVRTLSRPAGSVIWRYPLLVSAEYRDDLLQYLWSRGWYEVTRWYPSLQAMTAALAPNLPQPPTPNADRLGAEVINLPVLIKAAAAQKLARDIRKYLERNV